ncbi:component of the polarisome [Thoreauomyces humboldtii]|nr:component of the polarisome [Thoreauomyces humboldtii]
MSEPTEVAATHYEHLRSYLQSYLQSQRAAGTHSNQRTSAREKLTRLTRQQFTELSTDVFDEMNRRQADSGDVPFLPVRDDFHPKRNQARQKLATLPASRFKDLASDVFYEIERRFPQVVDDYEARYGPDPRHGENNNNNSQQQQQQQYQQQHQPASAPVGSSNGVLPLQPEPRQVQVTTTSPYANAQQYETQYSQPYEGKALSAPPPADNGRPRSAADPSAVNFTSLDNLMADLGNMLTNPKPGYGSGNSGLSAQHADLEKMRKEYEAVQVHVKDLEQDLEGYDKAKSRISDLEQKLTAQHKTNDEQAEKIDRLEAQHAKLKEDFESLQDDYNNQQQIANDIRAEATNLLDEIKSLSRKNEELLGERDRDRTTIKQLKDELAQSRESSRSNNNGRQQNDYANSSNSNTAREGTSSAPFASQPGSGNDDQGVIDRNRISAYQSAVDDLLRAARSDIPTSVLVAMKSIVIACKNITEDTEDFENSNAAQAVLTDSDRDRLADTKNRLASALNNLMNAAKVHATALGTANVAHLDAAATHLTATIVELVKVVRMKQPGGDQEGGGHADNNSQQQQQLQQQDDAFEIDELKIFLEKQTDQIVQAIQSLLYAMRAPPPNASDPSQPSSPPPFTSTVSGITRIVDNLVVVARDTLHRPSGQEFRSRGEMILEDLSTANKRLEHLGEQMVQQPNSKTGKQKLASSSYEIAKYVKELISLIE